MAEKKSLNPIPPTLRGKKRYVKFKLLSNVQLSEKSVWNSVLRNFELLFGGKGIAEQRLWMIKWEVQKNEGILRCSLKEVENVKAGILFVSRAENHNVIPVILKVSGSVKKLKSG